ncbi:restriction endonuclease subunit S [Streptomyces olivaceus]|uniref:restriction endonuclease subunit S n=1 Tax=Streptomyces olivaceus TaxID=47716 RepID=UPI001CCA1591|nr:restriction endonuclease subunit S [Streptomyces olivaceus]MBZ6140177.1 restriction endonuclease subunit S [Streptomyces olivaceus]MBZ6167719.1 restriction endonuclease subunit S [Streptomyces olivaceus]
MGVETVETAGRSWPEQWRRVRLADAGRWMSGGTPSTSNEAYWDGDIPWISGASMKQFRVTDSERRVTRLGAEDGSRLVEKGAVLFIVRGMSLKSEFRIGVTQREVAFGQDCKALVPEDGIDPYYLAYAMRVLTPIILSMVEETSHGTGRLDTKRLSALEIGVPSLPEQRDIVAANEAFERRIGDLGRVAQKRSTLLSAAVSALLRSQDSSGTTLDTMMVSCDPGITLGAHRAPEKRATGYLRVANVRMGWIDTSDVASLESTSSDRPRYELEAGDVLVVEGHANPEQIGRAALVGPVEEGLLYQNHLFRLRFDRDEVVPEFAMLWLNSEAVRSYWISRCATSSGLYTINSKLLAGAPFPAVPIEEQRKIVETWRTGLRAVDSLHEQIAKLRTIQQGVVEDLLSGRSRVNRT